MIKKLCFNEKSFSGDIFKPDVLCSKINGAGFRYFYDWKVNKNKNKL